MFSERKNFSAREAGQQNLEGQRRLANQQRQQRKLSAVFLSGDLDKLNVPDVKLPKGAEEEVIGRIEQGEIGDYQARDVISNIELPEGARETYGEFLREFPTPFHFEREREKVLNGADPRERAAQEAKLDAFSERVYGKRWEYYNAYLGMREQAEARREKQGRGGRVREALFGHRERRAGRSENGEVSGERRVGRGENGGVSRERRAERSEKELSGELVRGVGVYDLPKGFFRGERNPAPSEDAHYVNEETGTFAVFDGAGGEGGAREASQTALKRITRFIEGNERERLRPETENRMIVMLGEINRAVIDEKKAGYSTGVIAQIVENQGRKQMIYGSIGDSRIYVVRGNLIRQVTEDEGEGRVLENCFGEESCRIRQVGRFDLLKGDKVILCSDGVTGDVGAELVSDKEMVDLANSADHPQQIARNLVERTRKIDDRTAVVVQI